MADFLSNLLLRSVGDQPGPVVLRPRLPSLFEPSRGMEAGPEHAENKTLSDAFPSTVELFDPIPSTGQLPKQRAPSFVPETHQATSQPIQPMSQLATSTSSNQEPQQTILPRIWNEAIHEAKPARQAIDSPVMDEHREVLRPSLPTLYAHKSEEPPLPTEISGEQRQATIKPIRVRENSQPVEEVRKVEAPPKPGPETISVTNRSKPAAILQPALTDSRLAEKHQHQQPQRQESPQVVEIHIGRIEIRATPGAVTQQTKPRSATIMSLDEYLRSRSGDKR